MAAEEDDRCRQSRLQVKLCSEGEWIGVVWDVEIGAQDHAGGGEDVGVIVTDGVGLLYGSLGSGDYVLLGFYRNRAQSRSAAESRRGR